MASGARIILTSPDPSSNNAHPDTEHENTIFSETDTDSVTFNAHDKQLDTNDDESLSVSSNSYEMDESASTESNVQPQKLKISIDSVRPYEEIQTTNNNDIKSNNHLDDNGESKRDSMQQTNDQMSDEKPVKNDEL